MCEMDLKHNDLLVIEDNIFKCIVSMQRCILIQISQMSGPSKVA